MVIGRRVSRRKGQRVVALPPEVRERLGVLAGQWLYFHLGRKAEVVVSTSPARAGGKPPTAGLEEELTLARARIEELERERLELPRAARRAAWFELALQNIRLELKGLPVLDAINNRLRDIEAQLGIRRGPWTYRPKRGRHPRAARPVEVVEAPVLVRPDGAPVEPEARDPLSGEIVPAILGEGQQSP